MGELFIIRISRRKVFFSLERRDSPYTDRKRFMKIHTSWSWDRTINNRKRLPSRRNATANMVTRGWLAGWLAAQRWIDRETRSVLRGYPGIEVTCARGEKDFSELFHSSRISSRFSRSILHILNGNRKIFRRMYKRYFPHPCVCVCTTNFVIFFFFTWIY